MVENTLGEQLLDDLMGSGSRTPRENEAVVEILRLRKLLGIKTKPVEQKAEPSRPRAKRGEDNE